jgi:hypothetical protein
MRQAGIWNARRRARANVTRLGITAPEHIRIGVIAKHLAAKLGLSLRILDAPLEGADSQLVRLPGEVIILVSTRIKDPASRRFVIAHELGHLVLDHPSMPPHRIGDANPAARTPNDVRDYEAEANAFASELTMPYRLVRDICRTASVSLEVPWQIARMFGMSILASAIRFVELSPEPCAAVFSSQRRVLWSAESASFPARIERDRPIAAGSRAAGFWEAGAIESGAIQIPAHLWLDRAESRLIVEDAIASREYGTVLSMLWLPSGGEIARAASA